MAKKKYEKDKVGFVYNGGAGKGEGQTGGAECADTS